MTPTPRSQRRVLLTSLGSTGAQNLAWALKSSDTPWFIVGADASTPTAGRDLVDLEAELPHGSAEDYIARLLELARQHDVEHIVPVMEPELLAVAVARPQLDDYDLVLSSRSAIETCLSKRRLSERLVELGVPISSLIDPVDVDGPVFARRDRSSGSRGARRLEREQVEGALAAEPDLVLTEPLDLDVDSGTTGSALGEYSVDGYAHTRGELTHAIARLRIETRGGLAVRSTVVALEETTRQHVATICSGLGLEGFFNVQYAAPLPGSDQDSTAALKFFDVNPRLGGAMALSFAAGLDAARYLEARANAQPLEAGGDTRVGLRLLRRWHNMILAPQVRAGADR